MSRVEIYIRQWSSVLSRTTIYLMYVCISCHTTTVKESTTNTKKIASAIKNRIFAIRADAAETPEKPKKPATSETTKNMIAHFSMTISRLNYLR